MASVINGRLQTPQGAPKSIVFDLPSSMINSTKIEGRVQPYGQSTYSQAGQNIKFVIPRTDRAFLNTQTLYITGNADLTVGAGAAGVDFYYILGTYYSMFSRQVVSSNGKPLETLEKPGELANMILNQTLNPAERKAMANTFGFYCDTQNPAEGDATFNICQSMNTGNASVVQLSNNARSFSFSLPIIGLLNTAKMIPLINGDISIEWTLNAIQNFLVSNTLIGANAIAAGNIGITLSGLELCFDQLTLTPESYAVVMQNYPEKLYIKSQTYDFGTGTPFAVTSGAIDIPVNIKRSSLKQVLFYFTQANGIDKTFGGVNPNLTDVVFITNSVQYPQRPIRVDKNPSEVITQVMKSYGSLYSNNHSGSCGKLEFCRRTTASNNYYIALTVPTVGAADADYARILLAANKFYMAIDFEIINYDSDSLYSGIPMGVNSNFRLNISTPDPNLATVTPYYWMCYDAIIEMDLVNNINNVIA